VCLNEGEIRYETTVEEPKFGFNVKKYINIINHSIFLSNPISDTIIDDELRLYSYIYFFDKYGHYKFMSAYAKNCNDNLNDININLLQRALDGLGHHDIDHSTLRRMVQVIGRTMEAEAP